MAQHRHPAKRGVPLARGSSAKRSLKSPGCSTLSCAIRGCGSWLATRDRQAISRYKYRAGYTYEETHSFFTVGFSTTVPLFNRNQGPIGEAEAHRKEAAAAFLERQAQVIARGERALAVYTAALKEVAEAESLSRFQETQLQITQQAIRAGAGTQLSLDNVEIQSWVLGRARLDALARAQRALGELEDAVQRPLDPGGSLPSPRFARLNRIAQGSETMNPLDFEF